MTRLFLRLWWVPVVRGATALLFGILALSLPRLTLLALVAMFLIYAIANGIAAVIGALNHRRSDEVWWLTLVYGIASIAAGLIALFHPALTAIVLVLVMGALALVSGILDIAVAIRMRKLVEREWLLVLAGAIAIVFGLLVMTNPAAGALALVTLFSLYLLLSGATLLALGLRMRHWDRHGRYPGVDTERRILNERRAAP
jgi:uncharacterized membrane protein HdeD (DUF308 family)